MSRQELGGYGKTGSMDSQEIVGCLTVRLVDDRRSRDVSRGRVRDDVRDGDL